ncbi:acetate kinase [Mycoplasmatota bacterium]|nr:acetate kinase [Mycoplasmatota bacterium]
MSKILSVNAGSSSLKFKLTDMPKEITLVEGNFERIGKNDAIFNFKIEDKKEKNIMPIKNHEIAVKLLVDSLTEFGVINDLSEIKGVGHRVVHGGEKFSDSVVINDEVINEIDRLSDLAPLHNPANLTGIKLFQKLLPNIPSVSVFDTSFHQSMPKEAFIYGVPYNWYEQYGVRKYGFHGTSHKYVSNRVEKLLGKKEVNIIVCHLGNGGSICAVKNGKSVDTTMGFTPLTGLIMGTRCGDIDPAIISFIMNKTNRTLSEIESDLNKKSGLLGISGLSNDSRDIEDGIKKGNNRCQLAQDMFTRKIASYIASYHVLLGGADAIAFTGGIGENSALTRQEIVDRLDVLGVKLDKSLNNVRGVERLISTKNSSIKCFIVPTNEEVMIARDVIRLIND